MGVTHNADTGDLELRDRNDKLVARYDMAADEWNAIENLSKIRIVGPDGAFASIQSAIDDLPADGGTILVTDDVTETGITDGSKTVAVVGLGPYVGDERDNTPIKLDASGGDGIHIQNKGSRIEGITILGDQASKTGYGIKIGSDGDVSGDTFLTDVKVDVAVRYKANAVQIRGGILGSHIRVTSRQCSGAAWDVDTGRTNGSGYCSGNELFINSDSDNIGLHVYGANSFGGNEIHLRSENNDDHGVLLESDVSGETLGMASNQWLGYGVESTANAGVSIGDINGRNNVWFCEKDGGRGGDLGENRSLFSFFNGRDYLGATGNHGTVDTPSVLFDWGLGQLYNNRWNYSDGVDVVAPTFDRGNALRLQNGREHITSFFTAGSEGGIEIASWYETDSDDFQLDIWHMAQSNSWAPDDAYRVLVTEEKFGAYEHLNGGTNKAGSSTTGLSLGGSRFRVVRGYDPVDESFYAELYDAAGTELATDSLSTTQYQGIGHLGWSWEHDPDGAATTGSQVTIEMIRSRPIWP